MPNEIDLKTIDYSVLDLDVYTHYFISSNLPHPLINKPDVQASIKKFLDLKFFEPYKFENCYDITEIGKPWLDFLLPGWKTSGAMLLGFLMCIYSETREEE